MRNITNALFKFNLQLFNGGAAAPAAGGEGAAAEGAAQGNEDNLPKAETKGRSGGSRRGRTGEFDNVVFGRQDAAGTETTGSDAGNNKGEGNADKAGVTTTSDTLEAKRAAFEKLIGEGGEYKDIFAERTQQIINRRFKDGKIQEQTIAEQKPIMDILMQRYNIADGDAKALLKAIEEDNTYWEAAAEESGLTVDQYKKMKQMERESAELQELKRRQSADQQAQQQLASWMQQAEGMQELYPGFDFRSEIRNRDFQGLLRAGIPVQKAYELIHMEEIKQAAARSAAQTASQQMQANLKAKQSRPAENGTSSKTAVIVKNDVSKLTRAERAEVARRAMLGEHIEF